MRTLLLDDEPLALRLLTDYVSRHPDLVLEKAFLSPVDALEYLHSNEVDLVLLDVQMPELNGLHVARLLRDRCAVILTTAYEQHALAGFELDVVDYLLKPISFGRFARAVAKVPGAGGGAGSFASSTNAAPAAAAPLSLSNVLSSAAPFFVKSGHRTLRLDLDKLLYASSAGDYLTLHLADGSKILTLESLTDFSGRLPARRFCRIHRSHLVALDKIDFVERRRVVIGEKWLPVSDGFREKFEGLL